MPRAIKQHPAERLVATYLKKLRNTNNTRTDRHVIQGASTLINDVLTDCCPQCPIVTITSDAITVLSGRDDLTFQFCGLGVGATAANEPDLAEFLAGELNDTKTEDFLGTFTFDNEDRTVTYSGGICSDCDPIIFTEIISGG